MENRPIARNMIMGELFYVVGASGVGKDSLLDYVRSHIDADAAVVFAHRYITRPADAGGENHVALSTDEFDCRRRMGCFTMVWHSHDTWYGIGIEIDQWLAKGLTVVVNGSRAYLDEAAQRYQQELRPVLITAETETLRQRLYARGRETAEQIDRRLAIAEVQDTQARHPELVRISNDACLEEAGDALLRLIQGEQPQRCV